MLGRVLAGLPAELQERARDAAWERLDEAAEALAAIDPPLRAAFVEKPWLEWRGGVAYLRPEHAAEVPTAVVGVGRCPVLLGGEVRYHTEQDGERITVFVPRSRLRAGPAEAQVEITAGTLLVRERGALPGDALVHGRLWEAVAPKGSSWTEDGEDGGLRITLAKAPGGRYPWPHLLQDAPERFGGQEEVPTNKAEHERWEREEAAKRHDLNLLLRRRLQDDVERQDLVGALGTGAVKQLQSQLSYRGE